MLELKLVFPSTFRLSQIFFICCVDAAFCRHEPARGEVKQLRKSGSGRCSRDGRWDHRFSDFDFPQKSKPRMDNLGSRCSFGSDGCTRRPEWSFYVLLTRYIRTRVLIELIFGSEHGIWQNNIFDILHIVRIFGDALRIGQVPFEASIVGRP